MEGEALEKEKELLKKEEESLKRGVELTNRIGEGGLGHSLGKAFHWWKGGKLNKTSFAFIFIIFFMNLLVVYPLLQKNLTISFSSSAILLLANVLKDFLSIDKKLFFSVLSFISLSFAPISYYLLVRKIAFGHDLTAFLATLLFILPNPLFRQPPLTGAILSGDGAHALAFSFVPLVLIAAGNFIGEGKPLWGLLSSLSTAITAIVSPFALFNLLMLYSIITLAEGFMGNFRIKISRLLFLLLTSFGLSLFWYYPNVIAKIMVLSHVEYAIGKILSVLPILIPAIPVIGSLCFLVFDRREKLKPIFLGLSFVFIYLFLFWISKKLNTTGIFTADRYLIELSFSASFFFAVAIILVIEVFIRGYILKIKNGFLFVVYVLSLIAVIAYVIVSFFLNVQRVQSELALAPVRNTYHLGIGNLERIFDFSNIGSLGASIISLFTLFLLIYLLKKFPSLRLARKEETEKRVV